VRHDRLQTLTDGIFAIAATLLVLELKVPLLEHKSSSGLWLSLRHEWIIFLSYFMSFTVLYIFWRAQTFVVTSITKSITVWLSNLNGILLILVGLVPFSTRILGEYYSTTLGITIYASNIALIGLSLFLIRRYVESSGKVEHIEATADERHNAYVRILFPAFFAALAVLVSFISPRLALVPLLFGISFNLLPSQSRLVSWILKDLGSFDYLHRQ
jgi:uncharacterized membrane protein